MSTPTEATVLKRLGELRADLIARVAAQLTAALPAISPNQYDTAREAQHSQRMLSTAERFHDTLLVAASTDWNMIAFEYGWASRVLLPRGVTWEHQDLLIRSYFTSARELNAWNAEQLTSLEAMEQQLRASVEPVYHV
jgi:hypothetical protein